MIYNTIQFFFSPMKTIIPSSTANFTQFMDENNQVFYKYDSILFQIKDQSLTYFGEINPLPSTEMNPLSSTEINPLSSTEPTKINPVPSNSPNYKYVFQHQKYQNIPTNKTLLYFIYDSSLLFHTRILCETLHKQSNMNVFIIGTNLYDICINNVKYMNVDNQDNIEFIKAIQDTVHLIYIEDFLFFLHFTKAQFMNCSSLIFVYNYANLFQNYHQIELANNGLNFIKNLWHLVDKFYFYSPDDWNRFQLELDITNTNHWVITDYIISNFVPNQQQKEPKKEIKEPKESKEELKESKEEIKEEMDEKESITIICFDKYPEHILQFIEPFALNAPTFKYKLILFMDMIQATNEIKSNKNIQILPRFEIHFLHKCIHQASIFFTSEIYGYTHFNITMALRCNNINTCIIPQYFQQFKDDNRCILFNDTKDAFSKFMWMVKYNPQFFSHE